MSTVREKIITALTLFWDKAQSLLIRKANIVDNCVSTSAEYPLSANQGTQLQSQIDELNSNLTYAIMPDYTKQIQVSSLPYTALDNGWFQCILKSTGSLSSIIIDGTTVYNIGQTISSNNYVTTFVTLPIAKGQTVYGVGITESSFYFVPCIEK